MKKIEKKVTIRIAAILIFIFLLAFGIFAYSPTPKDDGNYESSGLSNSQEKYDELGLKEDEVEIWEDGMRTDGKSGSYEWWYVDAELNDGITAVIIFYTKDGFDVKGPANPNVKFTLTYPDGTVIKRTVTESEGTVLNSSTDKADIKIKDCYLRYVDGDYELYYKDDSLEFSAYMASTLPMWRPDTGHTYYGDEKKDFFAWIVAQPSSNITASLTLEGKTTEFEGTGYHDHNWGNIPMNEVVNHWYWGRAKVSDYDVIVCDIISEENTGFTRQPIFMIAKDGKIIEDDQSKTIVIREDTIEHPETGKFYDNHLTYIQEAEDGTVYTVEMIRENDIVVHNLLSSVTPLKRVIAKLMGMNPTYVRTLGEVILTIEKDGETQQIKQEGLWEQMYFGKNKDAYIWN